MMVEVVLCSRIPGECAIVYYFCLFSWPVKPLLGARQDSSLTIDLAGKRRSRDL